MTTPQHPRNSPADWPIRVYYEDTDAGGIVYYANYLKFFERARTEWLRHHGLDQVHIYNTENRLFVVRHVEIQYRRPAVLDDLLTVRSHIGHTGRASVVFNQALYRDSELLCEAAVTICCVDSTTRRPAAFSPQLQTIFEQARN